MSTGHFFLKKGRTLLQWTAIVYLLILTVLLVHPDALGVFGDEGKSVEGEVSDAVPGLIQHFSAYLVLGGLLYVGFGGGRDSVRWILLVAVLYGLATESIQAIVPKRTPELLDFLANVSGATLAVAVCSWSGSRGACRVPGAGDLGRDDEG